MKVTSVKFCLKALPIALSLPAVLPSPEARASSSFEAREAKQRICNQYVADILEIRKEVGASHEKIKALRGKKGGSIKEKAEMEAEAREEQKQMESRIGAVESINNKRRAECFEDA